MIDESGTAQIADPIMNRVDEQIAWYSAKSRSAQRVYKRLKVVEIIAAAVIPFIAGLAYHHVAMVAGGLGVLVTVIEGVIHLNQYQHNWTSYRGCGEALKHEKFMYLAKAGPYSTSADPHALLAERTETQLSQENARWAASQDQDAAKQR
jgi:hypothetical protein